jgi:Leucine-rich repeat (LRR) protein
MSEILTSFLTTPGVSSVAYLYLNDNQLTYVPREIKFFTQATHVVLDRNNISSIESGAFNFSGPLPLWVLELGANQLTTIAPGAFRGFSMQT